MKEYCLWTYVWTNTCIWKIPCGELLTCAKLNNDFINTFHRYTTAIHNKRKLRIEEESKLLRWKKTHTHRIHWPRPWTVSKIIFRTFIVIAILYDLPAEDCCSRSQVRFASGVDSKRGQAVVIPVLTGIFLADIAHSVKGQTLIGLSLLRYSGSACLLLREQILSQLGESCIYSWGWPRYRKWAIRNSTSFLDF